VDETVRINLRNGFDRFLYGNDRTLLILN
jgi:hypothetical protein